MKNLPNILFLADTTHQAGAVRDHIKAVSASHGTAFHWTILNPLSLKTIDKLDFKQFDAIGIHFSIKIHGYYYLPRALKKKIKAYSGFKFIFLQDEYQKVNSAQRSMAYLGINLLFTLVQPDLFKQAYPDKRLSEMKMIRVLTGYVDDELLDLAPPPIKDRTIDVSYRSRRNDYRLGKLGYDKAWLAEAFPKYAQGSNLTLDISVEESDRVYGNAWYELLKNSKVVLGTESGASIWDADGRITKEVKRFLRKQPSASFDTVFEEVLKPYEGNLMYSAISPRVFETAAAKACMVMFPGEYSGICKPNVHYIPLEKDLSNIQEVLEKIKDDDYLQAMADKAYDDLIASGLYAKEKLSVLVADEISKALTLNTARSTASAREIEASITHAQHRYKLLNQWRCFHTELTFILVNFFNLLFMEPTGTWSSKLRLLMEGAKRYLAYLMPRVKA